MKGPNKNKKNCAQKIIGAGDNLSTEEKLEKKTETQGMMVISWDSA